MSTSMPEPVPQRIGDAERDRALGYLRDHLAAGRLTQVEFDERASAALAAKVAADLDPLFTDLPAPRPGVDGPVGPPLPWAATGRVEPDRVARPPAVRKPRANQALTAAASTAWVLVVLAVMLGGLDDWWWLIFIPLALSSLAGSLKPTPAKEARELDR